MFSKLILKNHHLSNPFKYGALSLYNMSSMGIHTPVRRKYPQVFKENYQKLIYKNDSVKNIKGKCYYSFVI
jgi:hypothetical protein